MFPLAAGESATRTACETCLRELIDPEKKAKSLRSMKLPASGNDKLKDPLTVPERLRLRNTRILTHYPFSENRYPLFGIMLIVSRVIVSENRYPPIARRKTRVNALMINPGQAFSGKCSGAELVELIRATRSLCTSPMSSLPICAAKMEVCAPEVAEVLIQIFDAPDPVGAYIYSMPTPTPNPCEGAFGSSRRAGGSSIVEGQDRGFAPFGVDERDAGRCHRRATAR